MSEPKIYCINLVCWPFSLMYISVLLTFHSRRKIFLFVCYVEKSNKNISKRYVYFEVESAKQANKVILYN